MAKVLPNDGNFPPAGGPSYGINDEERALRARWPSKFATDYGLLQLRALAQ